jgi:hypothetical protein
MYTHWGGGGELINDKYSLEFLFIMYIRMIATPRKDQARDFIDSLS